MEIVKNAFTSSNIWVDFNYLWNSVPIRYRDCKMLQKIHLMYNMECNIGKAEGLWSESLCWGFLSQTQTKYLWCDFTGPYFSPLSLNFLYFIGLWSLFYINSTNTYWSFLTFVCLNVGKRKMQYSRIKSWTKLRNKVKRLCFKMFYYYSVSTFFLLFVFPLVDCERKTHVESWVCQIVNRPWILCGLDSSTHYQCHCSLRSPSSPLFIQTKLLEISPKHFILSHDSLSVWLLYDNSAFFCFSPFPVYP